MKSVLNERRVFARINLKLPFRYRVIGKRNVQAGHIRDISVMGVGFVSDKFIPPSTRLRLEIGVPLRVINPVGEVVWSQRLSHSDRYRVGIEFTKINYKERCNLADYIDTYIFNSIKKG